MRARDLMTAPVITVHPWTSAKEAAELLSMHGFTALPVTDDDERLIGIVTEADLIRDRIPADTRYERHRPVHPVTETTVGALMTSPVTAMSSGTDVHELCQALVDARIRAMPIVDGSAVVGIVTRGDINRWRVQVREGVVHIADQYDDDTDRHVATLLALAVPGVVGADTVYAGEEELR